MIWMFFAGFSGLAVIAVAGWARSSRRKAEAEEKVRREQHRLRLEEQTLLSRAEANKRQSESE